MISDLAPVDGVTWVEELPRQRSQARVSMRDRSTAIINNTHRSLRGGHEQTATRTRPTPSATRSERVDQREAVGTNRSPSREYSPGYWSDRTFGIDRIALTYNIAHSTLSSNLLQYRHGKSIEGCAFHLHLRARCLAGGHTALRLEFNPSRVADPTSSTLASVPETLLSVGGVLTMLAEMRLFPTAWDPPAARITRLDIARDFHVLSPSTWLEFHRGTYAKYARRQQGHFNREGFLTGLKSGSEGTALALYDKTGRHASDAWLGKANLRFEAQLRGYRGLRRRGLASLDGLTSEAVDREARRLWGKSRLGAAAMPDNPWSAISRYTEDADRRLRLFGTYECVRQGVSCGIPVRDSVWTDLQACGLLTGTRDHCAGRGGVHLDWDTGQARPRPCV